ncbi:MAG: hypothetical protein AB1489_42030 [Acidobacteriota bacterium]
MPRTRHPASERLLLRLSKSEKDWIDWYCRETNQAMSEFIRGLVREFRHKHPQYEQPASVRRVVATAEE